MVGGGRQTIFNKGVVNLPDKGRVNGDVTLKSLFYLPICWGFEGRILYSFNPRILLNNQIINNHLFLSCLPKSTPTKSDTVPPSHNPVNIKVFGGEPGPAATLAPKLGPLGLVLASHIHRMLKKSVKTSSRKAENGKESESWFNSNAKTEPQKSPSSQPHRPSSSRNSATTKEIGRK